MPKPIVRDDRLHILLSREESAMLQALANHKGLTASDYLRVQIRDNWMRCAWCGADMVMREWVGPRKPWTIIDGLHVCADCTPTANAGRAPRKSKGK